MVNSTLALLVLLATGPAGASTPDASSERVYSSHLMVDQDKVKQWQQIKKLVSAAPYFMPQL